MSTFVPSALPDNPKLLTTILDALESDEKFDIDQKDEFGFTALMYAATTEKVKILLSRNADPWVRDNQGRTPLMLTTNGEAVELLIKAAEPGTPKGESYVNTRDNNGMTALMHSNSIGVTQYLVDQSADIQLTCGQGKTALMHTLEYYCAIIMLNTAASHQIDLVSVVNESDSNKTALTYACGHNTHCGIGIVRILLERGATPTQQDLIAACEAEALSTIDNLLAKDATLLDGFDSSSFSQTVQDHLSVFQSN